MRWMIGAVIMALVGTGNVSAQEAASMTSDAPEVWLSCQFEAGDVPGFCAKLQTEFAAKSGFALGKSAIPPEAERLARISVAVTGAHRANISLAVGRQVQGGFQQAAAQDLRLGGADAALRASAASALAYPLVKLLEALR